MPKGFFKIGLFSTGWRNRGDRPLNVFAVGYIPWEDIAPIQLTSYLNQTFISIAVKNEEAYLSQMNFLLQRSAYKANLRMGFPLINISLNTSAQSPASRFLQKLKDLGISTKLTKSKAEFILPKEQPF